MYRTFAIYFAVFAVSIIGVELFRRLSLMREMLDIPNERSSHNVPTPRGGGIIICLVSVATFFIYSMVSGENFYWAYFAGAAIVAVISLLDDIRTISPFWRIMFHSLAAGLAVWSLGGFEVILVPFYGIIQIGFWVNIFTFLWILWLINAYNFMDGIDGIVATLRVTVGFGWGLTGLFWGLEDIAFYGCVLAVSSMGFLLLNWQPAKIFMGDVGSAFLGYTFAVIPLLALKRMESPEAESILPWIAVVFVWFFVFDSVLTFFKRLFRGEKVWQPHREHIYQKLVIAGIPHSKVTGIYGLGSVILVFVVWYVLKNSMIFDLIVFAAVIIETILLVVFWQFIDRNQKTA